MPVIIRCDNFPLSEAELSSLWSEVKKVCGLEDESVTVGCVDPEEIRKLNKVYRNKDRASEALTFSYGEKDHDIAFCYDEVKKQARERGRDFKKYSAWVITHALLHVAGMDHEIDRASEEKYQEKEREVIEKSGLNF